MSRMSLGSLVLPLFFLANTVVTAVLILALGVTDPVFSTFPWIFGGAFAATLIPQVRNRLTTGTLPWRLLPVLLYASVIYLASSIPILTPLPISSDVFHPVEFAGLGFAAQLAANAGFKPRPRLSRLATAFLICVLLGVLDELHQSFVPNRGCTVIDVLLDTLGTALGTAIFLAFRALTVRRTNAPE